MLFILLFLSSTLFAVEENFVLLDGRTEQIYFESGAELETRHTPCSTFKIALSLMGFDSGILENMHSPMWEHDPHLRVRLEVWRAAHNPYTWMQHSCVWYSNIIAQMLGCDRFSEYLRLFEYGNQDASGGLALVWINSSLKASAKEQAHFVRRMLNYELPVSEHAVEMTKAIVLREELTNGWTLCGKTGWTGEMENEPETGWYVGWLEKENHVYAFAHNVRGTDIVNKHIPRLKKMIERSGILSQ